MEVKVLLFIQDHQLKRKVINCIADLGVPFVECFEEEELSFKMQLFSDTNRLYIHEFIVEKEDEQFAQLKKIKEKGWKVIVIFPKYLIEYIDKSQLAKVDDLLVLPVEIASLKNKLVMLLSLPMKDGMVNKQAVEEIQKDGLHEVIQMEVNRAQRGKYDLSFVMIDIGNVPLDIQKDYLADLKKVLRETDVILKAKEKNTYILICPFTAKNYLVEVENKIRDLFNALKNKGRISSLSKLYAYGLTLGEDGEDYNQLHKRLTESMHDTKLLDQSFVQNLLYTPQKLKAFKDLFKRF